MLKWHDKSKAYLLDVDGELGHSGLDQTRLVIGDLAKGLDCNNTLGLKLTVNI